MIKTISLGLVAAAFAYLIWQVTALNSDLDKVDNLAQQLSNLTSEIRSIDHTTTVDNNNTEQPSQTKDDQVILDIQNKTSYIEQRLTNLESTLTDLVLNSNQNNLEITDDEPTTIEKPAQAKSALDDQQQQQTRLELLEAMITDSTQADNEWANTTQVAIEQTIANNPDLDKATSTNTVCGGALCKIETILPATLGEEEKNTFSWNFLMSVLGDELPNGTYFVNNNIDGSQQLTYYLVRNGKQLPTVQ